MFISFKNKNYSLQTIIYITNQNAICNEKCIKPYAYPATYFDPYNQVSGYCFDKECNDSFGYKFSYQSCDFSRFQNKQQEIIKTKYCNQFVIQNIDISIQSFLEKLSLLFSYEIQTKLKEKNFSLFEMYSLNSFNVHPFNQPNLLILAKLKQIIQAIKIEIIISLFQKMITILLIQCLFKNLHYSSLINCHII
ncbi:unnamed protein product [Paramecium pentaurelia]|uniref:Uncharacterized protein n=1 Tax=Paramecium pentaurelia TaxID=43138 RepID=A0A8S1WNP2_9CILI|nr:unnamed protein product [Paramecium pentaurelia]